MKKGDCHKVFSNYEPKMFSMYPDYYSSIQNIPEHIFLLLVKEIEKFAVHDFNRFLYHLPNAPTLKEILNFVKCFMDYQGDVQKLGTTILQSRMTMLARLIDSNILNIRNEDPAIDYDPTILEKNHTSLRNANVIEHPNILFEYGMTPIHLAIDGENFELFKKLLEQGADIDIQDIYGRTPLMLASKTHPWVAKTLLEKGADLSIEDINQETAFIHAIGDQNKDVIKVFFDSGKLSNNEIANAIAFITHIEYPYENQKKIQEKILEMLKKKLKK
jgi:hypothetical protein